MVYQRHTPTGPLAAFIEVLWYYKGEPRPHAKERLLPDGTMELVVNLREHQVRFYDGEAHDRKQTLPGYALVGAHSQYLVIDTHEQMDVMGAHFKPGGAFPFFKMPVHEFHNLHVPLDALWGVTAEELRDRLLEAPTPADKFRVMEAILMAQAARPLERHPAVHHALNELRHVPHSRTISELTDQVGMSPKRFIERFRHEVGLTPKLFCRVRRFQEVIRLVAKGGEMDWAHVALSCGYFDQAHFIHDFRAFSGINPSTYLAQRTEHMNHVPLIG